MSVLIPSFCVVSLPESSLTINQCPLMAESSRPTDSSSA